MELMLRPHLLLIGPSQATKTRWVCLDCWGWEPALLGNQGSCELSGLSPVMWPMILTIKSNKNTDKNSRHPMLCIHTDVLRSIICWGHRSFRSHPESLFLWLILICILYNFLSTVLSWVLSHPNKVWNPSASSCGEGRWPRNPGAHSWYLNWTGACGRTAPLTCHVCTNSRQYYCSAFPFSHSNHLIQSSLKHSQFQSSHYKMATKSLS